MSSSNIFNKELLDIPPPEFWLTSLYEGPFPITTALVAPVPFSNSNDTITDTFEYLAGKKIENPIPTIPSTLSYRQPSLGPNRLSFPDQKLAPGILRVFFVPTPLKFHLRNTLTLLAGYRNPQIYLVIHTPVVGRYARRSRRFIH